MGHGCALPGGGSVSSGLGRVSGPARAFVSSVRFRASPLGRVFESDAVLPAASIYARGVHRVYVCAIEGVSGIAGAAGSSGAAGQIFYRVDQQRAAGVERIPDCDLSFAAGLPSVLQLVL